MRGAFSVGDAGGAGDVVVVVVVVVVVPGAGSSSLAQDAVKPTIAAMAGHRQRPRVDVPDVVIALLIPFLCAPASGFSTLTTLTDGVLLKLRSSQS
jgi:hypothetical protein